MTRRYKNLPHKKTIPSFVNWAWSTQNVHTCNSKRQTLNMHLVPTRLPRGRLRKQHIVDTPQKSDPEIVELIKTLFLRGTDKEISRNKGEKKNTKTNTSGKKHSETRVLVNRVYSTQHVHPMQLKGQAHASTSEKRPESTRIFYPHLVGKRQKNLIFLPK